MRSSPPARSSTPVAGLPQLASPDYKPIRPTRVPSPADTALEEAEEEEVDNLTVISVVAVDARLAQVWLKV